MVEEMVVEPGGAGMFAAMGAAFWLLLVGLYLLFSYLFYRIAKNAGQEDSAWWAFVPILSFFLMIKAAGRPLWWFVLCLIPIVNIVVLCILWIDIAKHCGQAGFWGFLMIIPIANLIATLVLAFSTPPRRSSSQSQPTRPRQPVGAR